LLSCLLQRKKPPGNKSSAPTDDSFFSRRDVQIEQKKEMSVALVDAAADAV